MQRDFCDKIIKLDRNIRFVGIVNSRGEVIEGGFQEGVEPLLNETEEQQMYMQSLWNLNALESYRERLGRVRYGVTEYEKVTLMTFPLGGGILSLSVTPKGNAYNIREKVMQVIKKKPRKKK